MPDENRYPPAGEDDWYALMEHAPVMFQSVGPDGHIAYVNRAWRAALGYSTDEALLLTPADIIDPACEGTCRLLFGEPMPGCSAEEIDAVLLTSGGGELRVRGTSLCITRLGRPVGSMALFVPAVCEPAAPADEGMAACLRLFLGALSLPVYRKDREGRLTWGNSELCRVTGRAAEEIPGTAAAALVAPPFAARFREMDEQLLETGGVQQFDGPVVLAGGALREVTFTQVACEDAPGEISGIMGTFHEGPAAGPGASAPTEPGEWCAVPGDEPR
jgi:PAS domain S-box-containing protein